MKHGEWKQDFWKLVRKSSRIQGAIAALANVGRFIPTLTHHSPRSGYAPRCRLAPKTDPLFGVNSSEWNKRVR